MSTRRVPWGLFEFRRHLDLKIFVSRRRLTKFDATAVGKRWRQLTP